MARPARRLGGIDGNIAGSKQSAADGRGLPVGLRLLVIVVSGLIGWAIPITILYLLW